MNKLIAQYFVDIIVQEMSMSKQSVWLRDQNKLINNDDGLYIIVGFVGGVPISNTTSVSQETVNNITNEYQTCEVQVMEAIQVDVLSRSNLALTRNWEVIAAMQSIYAQQVQEANNFKIFRIPHNFVNTSISEGGSMLNKYSITISALAWYRKEKVLVSPLGDYYDNFTQRVDDAKTIGTDTPLIEFEITPDSPPPP